MSETLYVRISKQNSVLTAPDEHMPYIIQLHRERECLCVCMCTRTCMYACVHVCVCACMCVCMHVCVHLADTMYRSISVVTILVTALVHCKVVLQFLPVV